MLGLLDPLLEAYRCIDVFQVVAVRVLFYYQNGESKEVYIEQTTPGISGVAYSLTRTWPHVIHALVTLLICDDVLQEAY